MTKLVLETAWPSAWLREQEAFISPIVVLNLPTTLPPRLFPTVACLLRGLPACHRAGVESKTLRSEFDGRNITVPYDVQDFLRIVTLTQRQNKRTAFASTCGCSRSRKSLRYSVSYRCDIPWCTGLCALSSTGGQRWPPPPRNCLNAAKSGDGPPPLSYMLMHNM